MDRGAWWATVNTHTHTHTYQFGFFEKKKKFLFKWNLRHLTYLTYRKQGFVTIHLLWTSKYTKAAGPHSCETLLSQELLWGSVQTPELRSRSWPRTGNSLHQNR